MHSPSTMTAIVLTGSQPCEPSSQEMSVGMCVGEVVGAKLVGVAVGTAEGVAVGAIEVGTVVGVKVGTAVVGAAVGAGVPTHARGFDGLMV